MEMTLDHQAHRRPGCRRDLAHPRRHGRGYCYSKHASDSKEIVCQRVAIGDTRGFTTGDPVCARPGNQVLCRKVPLGEGRGGLRGVSPVYGRGLWVDSDISLGWEQDDEWESPFQERSCSRPQGLDQYLGRIRFSRTAQSFRPRAQRIMLYLFQRFELNVYDRLRIKMPLRYLNHDTVTSTGVDRVRPLRVICPRGSCSS